VKIQITEAALRCGLPPETIERFIAFSWVEPAQDGQVFLDECDLARCRLIQELQEDFGVNEAAISVILNLIDQLNRLHREIRKI